MAKIEADHGDIFDEADFKCEKCGTLITGQYTCLNDNNEPPKFKYETRHYYLPECAKSLMAGNAPASEPEPPKKDCCCICKTPIGTDACMQLMDGRKIKPDCLRKIGVDPDDPGSARMLRSKLDAYLKGELVIESPNTQEEKRRSSLQAGEDFANRMQEAKAKADEDRNKAEDAKAAVAAKQKAIAEAEAQKKQAESDAKAKEAADKEQAEADKKTRLDAKGKWTIDELKDAKLRKEYFVAELTEGKPQTLLSDADFQTAFGMDREAFDKLPGWKQKGALQKSGFF